MNMKPAGKSEILDVLLAFRGVFLYVGLFTFIINMLMLVPSIYMLQVYDRVLNSRNAETLLMLTLLMLLLYVMMSALELIRSRVLVRLGANLDKRLNGRIFTATFEYSLRAATGNPAQALSDLSAVRQFLTGQGVFAFFDAPWFPIYLAVIFLLHPLLGVFSLIGAAILLGLAFLTEKITKAPLAQANAEAMAANNATNANLRNAEVIEAMGMLPDIQRRWLEKNEKVLALQALASDRAGLISAVTKFVRITLQSMILGAGALLVIQGELTAGGMIAASILMGRTLSPVELAIGTWKQLLSARSAYDRLNRLLSTFPARAISMSLPKPSGRVSVASLIAVPPGSNIPILRGVSFEILPGEVVGVIGASASGKSTLARLLMGIWPPHSGSVRLDGADVFTWNKEELGPYVGYLPQDVELFDGSIAENIARFGEINAELIIEAARKAGVSEMILHFPKGYDTPIGVGGSVLSGGQRQRIGLARALYGDPSLIVLDEPNANLDDAGEKALVVAVQQLKAEGKTVVLITHRTSIIGVVDKLVLLQAGATQLYGPRDQVLAKLQQAQQPQPVVAQGAG